MKRFLTLILLLIAINAFGQTTDTTIYCDANYHYIGSNCYIIYKGPDTDSFVHRYTSDVYCPTFGFGHIVETKRKIIFYYDSVVTNRYATAHFAPKKIKPTDTFSIFFVHVKLYRKKETFTKTKYGFKKRYLSFTKRRAVFTKRTHRQSTFI